jgi:glycosyltransferase involved in cell wall biosynthesis
MDAGISVVIPAFNEEKYLPTTLNSIHAALAAARDRFCVPTEVIVVNNLSTDQTRAIAEKLDARVIDFSERNIAAVRNCGIRAAHFKLVVTVDADNVVPPDAYVKIWLAMQTGNYIGGGVRLGFQSGPWTHRLLLRGLGFGIWLASGISCGMFFFWHEAAIAIDGFPEKLLVGEDTGFALRLRRYGRKHGLKFCNLHSVRILTSHRKTDSPGEVLVALFRALKLLLGFKVTRDELDFWYNPKR